MVNPWEDPFFIVQFASTIFFAATVVFLIFGVFNQKKALTQDSYFQLRNDHHQTKKSFVSNNVLQKLVRISDEEELDLKSLTMDEKKTIIMFYVAEFDLYERLWYEYNKNKVPEAEWINWLIWLEKLNSPLLEVAVNNFEHVFEKPVMNIIKKNFIDKDLECKFCNIADDEPFSNLVDVLEHLDEDHSIDAHKK